MDAPAALVAALRAELGLTLMEMGERIGLSKSQMHEVERTDRASLRVALAIEDLSAELAATRPEITPIDAALLCEDVRLSRESLARHGHPVTADADQSATGQARGLSGGDAGARA